MKEGIKKKKEKTLRRGVVTEEELDENIVEKKKKRLRRGVVIEEELDEKKSKEEKEEEVEKRSSYRRRIR